MKLIKRTVSAAKKALMVRYHRWMANAFRKYAAHHADLVIHTQHRVPTASLTKLRGLAEMHDLKAKALRIGE
ncbi:hypothetical protein [Pseudomonas guariconensis]|uniref:hypothetical protein n=1 Tax=Pseudomonas guariconensis TaxID=1288410 RepID=UPI0039060043